MSEHELRQGTSNASPGKSGDGAPGVLRRVALIAVAAGALGSVALTLYAGRSNNLLILKVLFTLWVLSPFVLLGLAHLLSKRWSA